MKGEFGRFEMVQMHRRTDMRRSKEFNLQAIAVLITNDAENPSRSYRSSHFAVS